MQLWKSLKYAFWWFFWGKSTWRLKDCLHNNYIEIEFSSYFPFFGSIFPHFLRILIDFYRTTTLGFCILHILSFKIYKLSHSLGPFSHLSGQDYTTSCPIHWVRTYIYQVRSTSLDSDFCRVSTVMYSIVHFYPIACKRMVMYAQHVHAEWWAQREPLLGIYGGTAYIYIPAWEGRIVSWSMTMP